MKTSRFLIAAFCLMMLASTRSASAQHNPNLGKVELNNRYDGQLSRPNLLWTWKPVPGATKYFVWPTWKPHTFGHFVTGTEFREDDVPQGRADIGWAACNEQGCGEAVRDEVTVMLPAPRPIFNSPLQGKAVQHARQWICWEVERGERVGPADRFQVTIDSGETQYVTDNCANVYLHSPGLHTIAVRGINRLEPSIWVQAGTLLVE